MTVITKPVYIKGQRDIFLKGSFDNVDIAIVPIWIEKRYELRPVGQHPAVKNESQCVLGGLMMCNQN
ncbi:hypothetical protein C8R31_10668 [Nitrosospira sp. Nsp2]|nr:hypothetical protein C8R31_10668 [Nitrosospira sp. Nsp2]